MGDLVPSNDKFGCKYWAFCVVLIIPFSMYSLGISSVTLSEWSMIFGVLLFLVEKRNKLTIGYDLSLFLKAMFVFFTLSIVSHIIQISDLKTEFIFRHLRLALSILFILIAYNTIDKLVLLRMLRNITIVAAIYVLLQYIFFHVLGIYLPNKLLPLPVFRETGEEVMLLFEKYYFRAYGFFTEPSYFAKFCIPGFAYCLYGWGKNHLDYFGLALISTAVFCSTSMQGIVLTVFMCILSVILKNDLKKIKINKLVIGIILVLFITLIILGISQQREIDFIARRLAILSEMNFGTGGSISYRLLRGYYVFDQLPWYFQFFGIGFGNLAEYVLENGIYTPFDKSIYSSATVAGYVNGISYILICGGVVGFSVFVYLFYKIYKRSNDVNQIILLTYLLSLFSGGGIFNSFMVYILSIVFIGNNCSKEFH